MLWGAVKAHAAPITARTMMERNIFKVVLVVYVHCAN
jgi:hypothetical protein